MCFSATFILQNRNAGLAPFAEAQSSRVNYTKVDARLVFPKELELGGGHLFAMTFIGVGVQFGHKFAICRRTPRSAGCKPWLSGGVDDNAFEPSRDLSPAPGPMTAGACRYDLVMTERRAIVEARRDEIRALVRRHRGRSAALFGSVARGEDTAASDIDFLVDFEAGSSLFDLLHLQDELAALLGCPVDVVSVGGLKPRDAHIRSEALPL